MATVTGAMLTSNILSDQLALDFGDEIALLDPKENPFTLFARMADKRRTASYTYSHFEDRRKARFDSTSGTATTTIQTIPVTTGAAFQQWDLVQNTRTGEIFRVDGVAGNNLAVTRNISPSGVGTGTAMNAADELMIVGTAQPENDTSKPARSDVPSKVTNFTQILRTPIELSDRLRASMFQLSPSEWGRQQKMKGIEHAIDIESAFIFGKKSDTTPGAAHNTTTAGILAHITTNQTDAGGDLSEAEWNAFMATAFVGGGGSATKLALGSSTAVSALNKFPAAKQQTSTTRRPTAWTSPRTSRRSARSSWPRRSTSCCAARSTAATSIVSSRPCFENISYRYLANDELSFRPRHEAPAEPPAARPGRPQGRVPLGHRLPGVKLQETHAVSDRH
jgi:hypothetical protein